MNKHQKDIIKAINSGNVYDIYSYLKYFGFLHNYKMDVPYVEKKFNEEQKGKTYQVKKQVYSNFFTMEVEEVPAKLVFVKSKFSKLDESLRFEFDICQGVEIASSFESIKNFISIWVYLKNELYVLEVPKTINEKEVGVFYEIIDKVEKDKVELPENIALSDDGKINDMGKFLSISNSAPEIDACTYMDNFLQFNEDNYIVCKYYLDKKILATSDLKTFIDNKFQTFDHLFAKRSLRVAYIGIGISIVLGIASILLQNQDAEFKVVQDQLSVINQNIENLNSSIKENKYNDTELKNILKDFDNTVSNYILKEEEDLG